MGKGCISSIWGVIGAMEEEIRELISAAHITARETIAGMEFCSGILGDSEVVLVKSGMGKVNAGICAQILITRFHAGRIVNTGVAGSLDNRIDIGDFVISEDAVQHDFDVSPIGFRKGEIPFTGLTAFPADAELRRAAVAAVRETAPEIGIFEGRICSGDQFIASRRQKEEIIREYGGLCCEMEGAAIAQVCTLNRIPFVIIRAVSDKADDSEEVSFAKFSAAAASRCAAAVQYMILKS